MKAKPIIDSLGDKIIKIIPTWDTESEYFARIVDPPGGFDTDDFYAVIIDSPWYTYRFKKIRGTDDVYSRGYYDQSREYVDDLYRILFNQSREYVASNMTDEG
jgi:hypothetical protein